MNDKNCFFLLTPIVYFGSTVIQTISATAFTGVIATTFYTCSGDPWGYRVLQLGLEYARAVVLDLDLGGENVAIR